MGYAFISYSTKNQSDADLLRNILNKKGIQTWMAPGDIPPGSKYARVINNAIKECSCLILLLTNAAQNSVWVSKEVERAVSYGKAILPIKMEDITLNDDFEFYISTNQIIAMQKIDDKSEVFQKFLSSLNVIVESASESEVGAELQISDFEESDFIQAPTQTKAEKTTSKSNNTNQKSSAVVKFFTRWESSSVLVLNHFYLSELILYAIGLISFFAFLIYDTEYAFPFFLIFFLIGYIPSMVRRLVLKKPFLPVKHTNSYITGFLTLIYSFSLFWFFSESMSLYKWIDKHEEDFNFYQFEDMATSIFVAFLLAGIVFGVIVCYSTKKSSARLLLGLSDICSFSAMISLYMFMESKLIIKEFVDEIYNKYADNGNLIFFIALALCSIVLFVSMKAVSSKKADALDKKS